MEEKPQIKNSQIQNPWQGQTTYFHDLGGLNDCIQYSNKIQSQLSPTNPIKDFSALEEEWENAEIRQKESGILELTSKIQEICQEYYKTNLAIQRITNDVKFGDIILKQKIREKMETIKEFRELLGEILEEREYIITELKSSTTQDVDIVMQKKYHSEFIDLLKEIGVSFDIDLLTQTKIHQNTLSKLRKSLDEISDIIERCSLLNEAMEISNGKNNELDES